MLLATGAVVVAMFLIMKWSFNRGFLNYVNNLEKEHLVRLKADLETAYALAGSWDFLIQNPAGWDRILAGSRPRKRPGNDPPPGDGGPPFPKPLGMPPGNGREMLPPVPPSHRNLGPFEARLTLLDSQKNHLCGHPGTPAGDMPLHPLVYQEKTIGYLRLVTPKAPPEAHQMRFLKEQKLAMALIALAMLLIAACLSLPIANQMVRPIRSLVRATRELSSGNYRTRAKVVGQDELGQLARDFNTLAMTLEENEKARRQWVADISHELRTPLAVLRAEIEAIQDGIRNAGPESLKALHGEVLNLTRLVNDLYELSMSDIGALSYKKIDVDPVHLLNLTLEGFKPRLGKKNIRVLSRFPDQSAAGLWADPQRLCQLFSNLVENSLYYTDPDGLLEIRVHAGDGELHIDFLDSPPGVSEQNLPRLFDRLYRVEASRSRAHGGAGLGLSICKNIVFAHQGRMEAKPSPHGGLWIAIILPLKAEES